MLKNRIDHSGDSEKMDLLMKFIKAVHSTSVATELQEEGDLIDLKHLEKQRQSVEKFSKLATPRNGIEIEPFNIPRMHELEESEYIECERIEPVFAHRKDRIILYCHGGGYTCGGLGYARILAAKLALDTGHDVFSFAYSLAPEKPYPAAINDAMSVYDYLLNKGYGSGQIILAGDSAGGNLVLEMCMKLKEQDRFMPRGLILMSPWTDMTATAKSYQKYKDLDPLLTIEYVHSVRAAYAGEDADYSLPQFSPINADLTGFPPTLIQVGSNEILKDDSVRLYKKMLKSEIKARVTVYNGGWHVFQQMPLAKAQQALCEVRDFIEALN